METSTSPEDSPETLPGPEVPAPAILSLKSGHPKGPKNKTGGVSPRTTPGRSRAVKKIKKSRVFLEEEKCYTPKSTPTSLYTLEGLSVSAVQDHPTHSRTITRCQDASSTAWTLAALLKGGQALWPCGKWLWLNSCASWVRIPASPTYWWKVGGKRRSGGRRWVEERVFRRHNYWLHAPHLYLKTK